jgi:hypothetical protein
MRAADARAGGVAARVESGVAINNNGGLVVPEGTHVQYYDAVSGSVAVAGTLLTCAEGASSSLFKYAVLA